MGNLSEQLRKGVSECCAAIQFCPDTKHRLALYSQLYGLIRAGCIMLNKKDDYSIILESSLVLLNQSWYELGDARRWPGAEQRMILLSEKLFTIAFAEDMVHLDDGILNISHWMLSPEGRGKDVIPDNNNYGC